MASSSSNANPAEEFSASFGPFEETLTDLKRLADIRVDLGPEMKAAMLCEEHIRHKLGLLRRVSPNLVDKRLTVDQCLLIGEMRIMLRKAMLDSDDFRSLPCLSLLIGDVSPYRPIFRYKLLRKDYDYLSRG